MEKKFLRSHLALKEFKSKYLLRIMRLSLFLPLLMLMHLSAVASHSQTTVHFNKNELTINELIREIESQTDYLFIYSMNEIDVNQKIKINTAEKNVDRLLSHAFTNTDVVFLFSNNYISLRKKEAADILASKTNQQDKNSVKGKVVDSQNIGLIGVAIKVKESDANAITDVDGRYVIKATPGQTLVFSYIGFKSVERIVPVSRTLDLVMEEDIQDLDEIVVVGYGKQKKLSVSGSLAQIAADDVIKISTPNMANAIAGKMPGIITRQSSGEPGYDAAQVYIRGLATFTNSQPLILIDGVERDMNQINAQEIESFTVLKDASATAVYGARGANGVILITTKRGKLGKPTVILRSEVAVLTALRLPNYINGPEYAQLMNEALTNSGQLPRWSEDEIRMYSDGSSPYLYPNVNWTDAVLKKNTMQTINNLSVTGGSDIIKYYMNVGYTLQEGLYKEDPANKYNTNAKISRYNFRSNMDVNLAKNFVLQLGLGGIIQTGNYPGFSSGDIFHTLRMISPIAYPIHNPDGSLGGAQSYVGWNPYGRVTQSGYSTQDRVTLQGSFAVNWGLDFVTKGLSARALFSYDRYSREDNSRPKEFGVKRYLGKDPDTGEDIYSPWFREEQPLGYSRSNEANRAMYLEAQLNYSRTFGEKHDVSAMLLFNQREYVDLTAGTSKLNIPYRRRGYAGRATYAYGGRYLAEFNFGYNGSENFPKGKRFGFFPSGSVGWIVSEESFFKSEVISKLKLRASYGLVGNDQIGQRFLFLSTINTDGQSYMFGDQQKVYTGMDENQIGNQDVTWEEARKANIGFDLGLFKDKISLQMDVFQEKREGILIQRQIIPQATGIYPWSVPYGNLGIMENKGVDALLEIRDSFKSGFFYSFQGNFTFARNKVIENDEPTLPYPYLSSKGVRYGQYKALIADGFFKDQDDIDNSPYQTFGSVRPGDVKYKDVNGDGIINSYDQMPVGYARTPEISFGFGGTVGYKNWDVSVFFTGAANTTINIGGFGMWPFYDGLGSNNVLKEYFDNRWTPENPNAKYPAVDVGNNPNNFLTSTLWMKNGNYLRLRNAEIGYTLPPKLLGKYNFGKIRLFVNGMNLYTWDNIGFMDPESNDGVGGYPLQRTINFGLQIDFH